MEENISRVMLVTLAARLLLASLAPAPRRARTRWLHRWCQHADGRLENGRMPLYRLRWALSRLWLAHPPRLTCWRPYPAPTPIPWPIGSLRWWMTFCNGVEGFPEHLISKCDLGHDECDHEQQEVIKLPGHQHIDRDATAGFSRHVR